MPSGHQHSHRYSQQHLRCISTARHNPHTTAASKPAALGFLAAARLAPLCTTCLPHTHATIACLCCNSVPLRKNKCLCDYISHPCCHTRGQAPGRSRQAAQTPRHSSPFTPRLAGVKPSPAQRQQQQQQQLWTTRRLAAPAYTYMCSQPVAFIHDHELDAPRLLFRLPLLPCCNSVWCREWALCRPDQRGAGAQGCVAVCTWCSWSWCTCMRTR